MVGLSSGRGNRFRSSVLARSVSRVPRSVGAGTPACLNRTPVRFLGMSTGCRMMVCYGVVSLPTGSSIQPSRVWNLLVCALRAALRGDVAEQAVLELTVSCGWDGRYGTVGASPDICPLLRPATTMPPAVPKRLR